MPLPTPRQGESRSAFVSRCAGNDTMNREYPDNEQRLGVCYTQWRRGNNNEELNLNHAHVEVNGYNIRQETHQGRKHLVVPVVMMVEGVHNGSHGPLLHLSEELGRWPEAWSGIPVVVDHPSDNEGNNVSANEPVIVDSQVVGRVYNTVFENNKLKGEVWLDEQRLRAVSPLALAYIMQSRPLDVSVGCFSDDESQSGTWDNEVYTAIARNHRPDHLALLPGGRGACSWSDGCGIRANEQGGKYVDEEVIKLFKDLHSKGFSVVVINQAEGYRELVTQIQTKLDGMDDGQRIHYLEEVWENSFVYRVETVGAGSSLFKRNYSINESGEVSFGEDIAPVRKKVDYVEVGAQNNKETEGEENMNKEKNKPCCPEKVQLLIQSEHSTFKDEDAVWLETLNEDALDRLIAGQKQPETNSEEGTVDTKEQAIEVLRETVKDPKTFMELLPDEFKAQYQYGMSLYKDERTKLQRHILDNTKDVYTQEELDAMPFEGLQKLAKAVKSTTNYSALGGGGDGSSVVNTDTDEILLPVGIKVEK